jgi:hypothetical protein
MKFDPLQDGISCLELIDSMGEATDCEGRRLKVKIYTDEQ